MDLKNDVTAPRGTSSKDPILISSICKVNTQIVNGENNRKTEARGIQTNLQE